jgi:tetratricopeptide (TPR) repeat protein
MTDSGERVVSLLAEADALIRVKRYQAAAERAHQAAVLMPSDPRPLCEWSRALYGEGRLSEAAQMADEVIRLAPESAIGFRLRGTALSTLARQSSAADRARLGREAVASAREAVRLAPWDPNSHIGLAQALPLTGELHQADMAAQEAIRLAPNSAGTWVAASLVALGTKNWNAAITASRRALAIEPDNYAALNNLGVALRAAGKRREGTELLARAARADPDAPTARRNLSRAGLNVARLVILVALIPIGFLAHVGLILYVVFAIGSNLLISKNPDLVLRLERWAAPVAMLFAKRSDDAPPDRDVADDPSPGSSEAEGDLDRTWSSFEGRGYVIGTPVVVVGALAAWSIALIALIGLVVPGSGRPGIAAALVLFVAIAVWPTMVVVKRRRNRR